MDGQVDIFELLDDKPPVPPIPPFTVFVCVWASGRCGWCDKPGWQGGGGCVAQDGRSRSWYFNYCKRCVDKYGHPSMSTPAMEIIVDRTEKPRPELRVKKDKEGDP